MIHHLRQHHRKQFHPPGGMRFALCSSPAEWRLKYIDVFDIPADQDDPALHLLAQQIARAGRGKEGIVGKAVDRN